MAPKPKEVYGSTTPTELSIISITCMVALGLFLFLSACCVWVFIITAIILWSQNDCQHDFNLYLPAIPTCNNTCPGAYFVGQIQLTNDCNSYSMVMQYVCPIIGEPSLPRIENVHVKNTDEVIVMPEDHSPTIPFEWNGKHLMSKGKLQKKVVATLPKTLTELRKNPQNHRLILYTAACPTGAYQSVIL